MNIDINAVLSDSPATLVVADFAVANRTLTFKNLPQMDTRQVERFVVTTAVAETLNVRTATPTAAVSKNFRLVVSQWRADLGQTIVRELAYTSKADGSDTATTICDKLRSALLAYPELKVAGTGTATLIVTALTGFPIFNMVTIGDGVISIANTTAGVAPVNTYQALTYKGVAGVLSGKSYTSVECIYRTTGTSDNIAGNVSVGRNRWVAYIQNDVTNYAAIATRITEHANGYGAGVTTANPATIALVGA